MKLHLYLLLLLCLAFIRPPCAAQVVTTIAGTGTAGYFGDGGPATAAYIDSPCHISRDAGGDIFFSDQNNNRIRKVSAAGIISTVAGNGIGGFSGDNAPATNAQVWFPWGIALDVIGDVYISDQVNRRIRKVNTTGIITSIAGTGGYSSTGDGGPATAATFERPIGLATDAAGNIYVADQDDHKIRKITPGGSISTFAGTGLPGSAGDGGQATNATFTTIFGISTDNAGNLYICDAGTHVIRRVNTAGIITTVAGSGTAGFSGDGGAATTARLNGPVDVFVTRTGEIYIADARNNRIRIVDNRGIINTVAGTGSPGFNGDGNGALSTKFSYPVSVAVDDSSTVYVSDWGNNRIRQITKILRFTHGHSVHLNVCQNLSTPIDTALSIIDKRASLTDVWSVPTGFSPAHGSLAGFAHIATSTGGMLIPSGLSYTPIGGYTGNDSFTVIVNDGLDSSKITVYITVDPSLSYVASITGASDVCVGSTIALADSTPGGSWSVTNLSAVVSNGVVHGESPGKDTVVYTVTNACGTVSSSKEITVHALPDAGTIAGQHELCIDNSVTLSSTVNGGTWGISDSSAKISVTGELTGNHAGSGSVVYTVHDAYCMNKAFFSFTVDPLPTALITVGQTSICVNGTTNITGIPEGGVWSVSNGNVSIQGDSIKGINEGVDTISYSYTNFCGAAVFPIVITVNPLPVAPSVAQKESVISVPPGYASYLWQINGNAIPGALADTYLVAETGLYSVVVTNSFGCAAASPQVLCTGCTADDIRLFPNPTRNILYVKWCKNLIIRILCMDGKEVKTFIAPSQIDISGLPNADYLLSIFDMNGHKLKTKLISKVTN